jgi:hypothetical protein
MDELTLVGGKLSNVFKKLTEVKQKNLKMVGDLFESNHV